MAGSTSHLDLIATAQAQKEVTANALFDAASTAVLFGRRASACIGLTWGYYGGPVLDGAGDLAQLDNGTLSLAASDTNYVEYDRTSGVVSCNTTGFTAGRVALYEVVTGAASVTSYTDWRITTLGLTGGNTAAADVAIDDAGGYFTGGEVEAALQELGAAVDALATAGAPFDVTAFYPGVPSASAKLLRVPVARAVSFADDFAGSIAKAGTAATASTVFDVQKNGASVGSITFAAAAGSATFVTSGAGVSLAAGDVLAVIAPATPDATLADVGLVLAGTR